ncbi:MAG: hypothetical protein M1817_000166 [Caeruleum heppii]|nr:MAG: hypothetical protein M1817_000166 [Caeruleum heppii]
MHLSAPLSYLALSLGLAHSALSAASWGFDDATVTVHGKSAGVGEGQKVKLSASASDPKKISLGLSDTLKVILTAQENAKPKRPHQAFLAIEDRDTGLETSYVLSVKESGKGKVEVAHKDLPVQLINSNQPLRASIVLASFGSAKGLSSHVFDIGVEKGSDAPTTSSEKALRYGKLEEIHYAFPADPKSPPKIITLAFGAAALATLPILFGTWLSLGANVNHLSQAMGSSPVSHALFFGSIILLEGIFYMYYARWNLFQTLPAVAGAGSVAFLSGSRALSEVQERRLAGLR